MKILFVSLGCDKNLVDSEEMLGDLTQAGYEITDDEEEAEAAVVNTCCFINDAKKESIESILELAERRTAGQLRALIVTGCLAQRYSEDILREIPEVDAVIGTTAQDTLVQTLQEVTGRREISGKEEKDQALVRLNDLRRIPRTDAKRVLTTANGYAYLRIAEGCSKCCTYCVIPSIRGGYRSLPMESVIRTAGELAAQGVRELILVAQETTVYGTDLYGKKMLPELLDRLAEIDGIRWIRLLYCYPEEITPELVETIRQNPKILHYIDMPIQHASDDVLRRMGRRTNKKELEDIIGLLRKEIPDICLRTTLISGFPGETEKDHRTLMSFVRRMKFERLGVFAYSREEGTPAAKMKSQIPAPVKKKRRRELMLLQQEIAFKKARRMKGRIVEAIVEGRIVGEDVYTARTYMDAPGVDGTLFIETGRDLMTGDFVKVKITGSDQYDLIGEIVD
jgi:ribosomal protein S12 methylthiotransferase